MKYARNRAGAVLRAGFPGLVLGLLMMLPAVPAQADDGDGASGSIIDTIIDWIEDFFDPEDPDETLPSDGDGW